jgi:hypothetical protein
MYSDPCQTRSLRRLAGCSGEVDSNAASSTKLGFWKILMARCKVQLGAANAGRLMSSGLVEAFFPCILTGEGGAYSPY